MTGKHTITVHGKRFDYELEITRKVTVIKGNSGTGKTTLINALRGYATDKRKSGYVVYSDLNFGVLSKDSRWNLDLTDSRYDILFVDENVEYIYTKAFQVEFANSDKYLVVISRSGSFCHLPYAVNSVYEFRTSKTAKGYVTKMYNIYKDTLSSVSPDLVITEDSNSGKEMMDTIFNCDVISANGNGSVYSTVVSHLKTAKVIYVIVDGAAFGGYIQKVLSISKYFELYIFSPESFEYLLLNTGTFRRHLSGELDRTWDYCDISEFQTWEEYFTRLLSKLCKDIYSFDYSKSKLAPFFLKKGFPEKVKEQLSDIIDFNKDL